MIDGRNFFDQTVKNNLITYDDIRKITIGQGDYYTTGCLLDYYYFNNYYKMIAIDLSKQQALDVDNTRVFFIIEEVKETILNFSQGTVEVL